MKLSHETTAEAELEAGEILERAKSMMERNPRFKTRSSGLLAIREAVESAEKQVGGERLQGARNSVRRAAALALIYAIVFPEPEPK